MTHPTNYVAFANAATAINDAVIAALKAVADAKDAQVSAELDLAQAKLDAWNSNAVTGSCEDKRKISLDTIVTPQRVGLELAEKKLRCANLDLDVAKEMTKWLDKQMTVYGWKMQYPQASIDANADSVTPVMAYVKQLEQSNQSLTAQVNSLQSFIDETFPGDELPTVDTGTPGVEL